VAFASITINDLLDDCSLQRTIKIKKAVYMTTHTKRSVLGRKKYLALALPLLMAAQAQSVEFKMGDVKATLDTQLSLGSSWRAEDADQTQVGPDNVDTTDDDGNRNYEKGDAFSQIFKASHDLNIKYENMGIFLRGKYWYDSAIENNKVAYGHGPTVTVNPATLSADVVQSGLNYNANEKLDDSDFDDLSKGSGATLLDAFVYGQFDLGEMPLDVRLGRQVVSWGESTFIQGGINSINPVDASAFRRPGAEIKEGLLPVGMVYANLGLTDNLSAEVFYQYEYQNTVSDPCGTYFSTSDIAAEGCNLLGAQDKLLSISRDQTAIDEPADDNQFGLAFRYYAEDIETEFGFFAMNIHNRAPIFNVIGDTANDYASLLAAYDTVKPFVAPSVYAGYLAADAAALGFAGLTYEQIGATAETLADGTAFGGALNAAIAADIQTAAEANTSAELIGGSVSSNRVFATNYAMSYPEDNQLMGISFSTNVAGTALSGEISHKLDSPVQINGSSVTNAVLARGNAPAGSSAEKQAAYAEIYGSVDTDSATFATPGAASAGQVIQGYREFDITQVQVTAINTFNNVAGASQIALVAEVGAQFVHGFDDVLRYGRASFFGEPTLAADEDLDGFATESSFGYRALASATYNNVLAGVDVIPTVSWAHDVSGTSAGPGGPFLEGNQSLGLSVKANYQQRYSASLAYTMYEGGDFSVTGDRDFISASVDVQF
jgi:hypothetical protein